LSFRGYAYEAFGSPNVFDLLNKFFWGTSKARPRGCAPARRLAFCSSATKSQQKQSLPCGRHDELGDFCAGRLLAANQQATLLAWQKTNGPGSLRSHGLNGNGAALIFPALLFLPS